jgi:SAM-dependent methyltransferase
MPAAVSGTEGYTEEAAELFKRYEGIPPHEAHRAVLHLIPSIPCNVLDIGAGTGRDAAWFVEMGHRVVAVEPTEAMRLGAMKLHPSQRIEWLDDSLPDLELVRSRSETFELVMLTAVWMHLDAEQRARAMPNVGSLLAGGGTVAMTLRHGRLAPGRRMFAVSAEETIALAEMQGLRLLLRLYAESQLAENRAAGVTWTTLAFAKPVG